MKLCLAILAITYFRGSNADFVNCPPHQISKADGCVPQPPNPDACDPNCHEGCHAEDREMYLIDFVSTYVANPRAKENCHFDWQPISETLYKQNCIYENEEIVVDCGVDCQDQWVTECKMVNKTIEKARRQSICSLQDTTKCVKEWVMIDCPQDPNGCPIYACTKEFTTIQVKVCTEPRFEVYTVDIPWMECKNVTKQTCEPRVKRENSKREVEVLEHGSCRYNSITQGYDQLVLLPCPVEKHILEAQCKKVTLPIQVCNDGSGFNGRPYIFDECQSADCTMTTEEGCASLPFIDVDALRSIPG